MDERNLAKTTNNNDINKTAWGWWILSFFVPIAGYVLYLVYKTKDARKSKSSGWGSLLGCAFYFVLFFVWLLFIK